MKLFKYTLDSLVNVVYSICVDSRFESAQKIIGNLDIDYQLVSCFCEDNKNENQTYNYTKCIQKLFSQLRHHERYCYIEDDIYTHDWFDVVLDNTICQLNKRNLSWDVLYLGCDRRSKGYESIDRNLLRVHHVDGFSGLLFNNSFVEQILSLKPSNIGIDGLISSTGIQRRLKCYSTYPNIIDQTAGFSYNSKAYRDSTISWTWA